MAFGGYVAGSPHPIDWFKAIHITVAVSLAAAGSESIANYLERDLDALMERTRRRPLPSGKIKPAWNALIYGVMLTALGLGLSLPLGILPLTFILIGVLDYVVVYVILTKRRTPLNIILGSFAGGAPVMAGYSAAAGQVGADAWLLAAIVVLWIPSHIWSLALRYKEDYVRAGVPMLPVVVNESKAIRCISSSSILIALFTVIIYFLAPGYGPLYLATSTVSGAMLLYLSLKLAVKPTRDMAWRLFKFTSPYLALIFLAIILDKLL